MKAIGLTGGIGSGKSTVARMFEVLGVPIFYADLEARTIVNNDPVAVSAISELLGDSIYINGQMDRPRVAEIVFSDPEKLAALNRIVHPAVKRRFEAWKGQHAAAAYGLKEAAILFDSGSYKGLDGVISVAASEQVRIARVTRRDGISAEQVSSRMANQWTETQRQEKADWIVQNTGDQPIIPQVLKLHQLLGE